MEETFKQNILEIKKICLSGKTVLEIKSFLEKGGFDYEDWYFDTVFSPSEVIPNLSFWKEASSHNEYVNPSDVVGHEHGSISSSLNWITLLSCLQRWTYDTDAAAIRAMLEHQDRSEEGLVHLNRYGKAMFFCEGRHRLVQARFLKIPQLYCQVTDFVFDEHAFQLYGRVSKIVEPYNIDNWRLGLPVKARKNGLSFEIPLNDTAVELLEQAIINANKISKNSFSRKLFLLRHPRKEHDVLYFNLNNIRETDDLVTAILKYQTS